MKDMLDDIPDDELRKKLQGYSEAPDDDLWDRISSGVAERLSVAERLHKYSEEPAEMLWPKIKAGVAVERSLLWLDRGAKLVATISLLCLLWPAINNDRIEKQLYAKAEKATLNDSVPNTITQPAYVREPQNATTSPGNPSIAHQQKTITGEHVIVEETKKDADRSAIVGEDNTTKELINVQGRIKSFSGDESKPTGPTSELTVVALEAVTPAPSEKENNNPQSEGAGAETSPMVKEYANQDEAKVADAGTTNPSVAGVNEMHPAKDTVVTVPVVIHEKAGEKLVSQPKPKKEESEKKKKVGGFYVLLMPTFGYQKITPVKNDNLLIESIEKVSALSSKRLGIRAEAGIERPIAAKLSYHAGILYHQRKQTITYTFKDAGNTQVEHLGNNVYKVSLPTDTATFEYELKNVGVILGLNYTTKTRAFMHKVGVAGELHRALNRVDREIDTGHQYYMFGNLYYRLSYPVSRKIALMFQPTLNYALQVDNRINAPFYVKPYGLGVNFGAYFHF